MVACVLIEYSVKSLNKTFDYIVPNSIETIIKVGHKVLVPFGRSIVEGFVLELKEDTKKDIDYKEITKIVDEEFILNKELLELGKYISKTTLCNLISSYQVMLPKALKASSKTNINKKYEVYVSLVNKDNSEYIEINKNSKKQLELIEMLNKEDKILKSKVNCSALKTLIDKKVVYEVKEEINREVLYIKDDDKKIVLTKDQENAYKSIINDKDNKTFLIHGVTGSGKTEIYIKVIEDYLSRGKTCIMLVPEISLTPQIVARFKREFGEYVAVIHSSLSEGEKYDEYRKILRGQVKVVVGARSAIFSPLNNLGCIIIDECGSASYKQDSTPKYNAIDVALKRCEYNNSICILGSATPSLEQYARGQKGVFKLITLDKRINNNMPNITLVDMSNEVKKRNFVISDYLKDKINDRLSKKEQVIILLNRRGFSTYLSCSSCGYVYKCPHCDITLTYHKSSNNLRCHFCGYSTKYSSECPSCHEDAMKDLGLGTEKLENILKEKFKEARILRMDLDSTSTKGSHEKLIESFKNKEYDILVGTQMISKGLNFPNVTLSGIINADASLSIPDFRSCEKTFELLMQTGGRSGRNDLLGEVVIQTYNPNTYVYRFIKNNDYIGFYKYEMNIRKTLKYPPYYYICSLKVVSIDYNTARDESVKAKDFLNKKLSDNFIILGPSTARIFKLNNKYHFNIIIKYKKEENLFEVLKELNELYITDKVKIDIDINPLSMI